MQQSIVIKCEEHNETVYGICTDKDCQAKDRIFCLVCIKKNHSACSRSATFSQSEMLEELRNLLEQNHQQGKIQINKDIFRQIKKDIGNLFDMMEQQYYETTLIERINNILMNTFTKLSWYDGYSIIQSKKIDMNNSTIVDKLKEVQEKIEFLLKSENENLMSRSKVETTLACKKEQISYFQQIKESIQKQFIPQAKTQLIQNQIRENIGQTPLTIQTNHCIWTIALAPDGKYVASAGSGDYSIKLWNQMTGKQIGKEMKGHSNWICSINYSHSGKLIISGSMDNSICQWNAQTQQLIGKPMLGHSATVKGVQYTLDQKYIVSCSLDKSIRIWYSGTGKEQVEKRIQHANLVYCLSLSPISTDFVIGDKNGSIQIYNYDRQQSFENTLQGHKQCINSISYSSDGRLIVSGSDDNTIIVWDVISARQIRSCIGHPSDVLSVSLSPDMRYIISGGRDHTVRLWSQATGELIATLTHHIDSVYATQFSFDGKYIFTGSQDQQLHIILAPISK